MSNQSLSESQQLDSLKGHRLGPYLSHNPVSATQIWQWCSAMADHNPRYRPGEHQVAPPAMMQMWTMRDFNDEYAPGSTAALPYQVFEDMKAMGYLANVAVSYDIKFLRELRIGERAKHYTSVIAISDRKTTTLGIGYFVTERVEYLTLDERAFADAQITYFQYQPAVTDGTRPDETPRSRNSVALAQSSTAAVQDSWRPDYKNINASNLHVGDPLPEVTIPITHKLIVGGAIASQDFIPVHHNVPTAQAAGMPDIFMNILTTSGLSARYLTDWAGGESRLGALKFNLMTPNFPGDVMVMKGEITALDCEQSEVTVTVAFRGENRQGVHTSGTATLTLPNIESQG